MVLGWLLSLGLENLLGKQIGKWVKYLVMVVVMPISLIISFVPTGEVSLLNRL
jgi:hypothetical protein